MCECGGELVECVCGDRCCDDCGCRDDRLIYSEPSEPTLMPLNPCTPA